MSDVAILTAKLLGVYDVGNKGFRVAHMKQYLLMCHCLILIVTCYIYICEDFITCVMTMHMLMFGNIILELFDVVNLTLNSLIYNNLITK